MHSYPILIDTRDLHALVVGAGSVGLRKIHGLLEAGPPARLTVVDPTPPQALYALASAHPGMVIHARPFADTDIAEAQLVFACTPDAELNRHIATRCRQAQILCNSATQPEDGSFALPACVRRGDFLVCVATAGASPALARQVRRRLEAEFGPEYGALTQLLAQIRPYVLALGAPATTNAEIFRALAASSLVDALRDQDLSRCMAILQEHLPAPLHAYLEDWCHACLDLV
ncbi:precorrin-2 dehydrogenase [Thermodesulfomicrobium sp. WS]|jgi:precorrin-2 dehydrogenase/sirohydrochlorin ferrochelatase|uniref:precorrin-2 dehydrogenase/sirohydrochlorin ferrochelatase family protein n=1 Tax=Thermodesulfomicrobium sp. WS TaxID=3004129 RepID=UPI0024931959|nr:bifunctional precorrin-2 dehydrogenase/sirohydrochlorin ferrochelatase [Thermodesulfomicrobium sp. WS]BDV01430.1 precorrin-2 dehydrogenase [Thermodesulfomicrobium sp. WS]